MRVLICGAGLSGMVLAMALKRCAGEDARCAGADPTALIQSCMKALVAPI